MAKIHEVAQAAGVSISTVSYALSGKRPIAPETREHGAARRVVVLRWWRRVGATVSGRFERA